jgi:CDP-diacylglycerol--glycerol-3-phosphate 3-phosphatidyltransferase
LAPGSRPALGVIAALLVIRMGLNAIEGMLAREHDQKSRAGLIYNEVGDVVSDAGLYLPLSVALAPLGVSMWGVVVFAFAAFLTEFTGVLGPHLEALRRYDGPMGKSDRAIARRRLGEYYHRGHDNSGAVDDDPPRQGHS